MTPTEARIVEALDQIVYALCDIHAMMTDMLDANDGRVRSLHKHTDAASQLVHYLVMELPLSPPYRPDKDATVPAGDSNQAAPEFASHSVGDRVEVIGPGCQQGVIIGIDPSGYATCKSEWGMLFFHDLCALKNLSRQEGGAK